MGIHDASNLSISSGPFAMDFSSYRFRISLLPGLDVAFTFSWMAINIALVDHVFTTINDSLHLFPVGCLALGGKRGILVCTLGGGLCYDLAARTGLVVVFVFVLRISWPSPFPVSVQSVSMVSSTGLL